MALTELYNGRTTERNINGIDTTVTYYGTKAECDAWAAAQVIGATYAGLGKLATVTVSQGGGSIFHVTAKYQNANGSSGSTGSEVVAPDYTFGEFSATMDCSMLSTPLEQHPNYRTCWNYYLAARSDAVSGTPQWWGNVTTPVFPQGSANAEKYKWVQSVSEIPYGRDDQGYTWSAIKEPTMPGIQSYDRALYTQTESARFRTRAEAVASIAQYANKIGTPINDPGSPFDSGKWKCDRATVEWTNEYWRATLTWTYSPDGWNSTLYDAVGS